MWLGGALSYELVKRVDFARWSVMYYFERAVRHSLWAGLWRIEVGRTRRPQGKAGRNEKMDCGSKRTVDCTRYV